MDTPPKMFPQSHAEAERWLVEHEQTTGYQTRKLVEGCYLMRDRKTGGIDVADGGFMILRFLPDGRIVIRLGAARMGRLARIGACLPEGWTLRRETQYRTGTRSVTNVVNVLHGPNGYRRLIGWAWTVNPATDAMPGAEDAVERRMAA